MDNWKPQLETTCRARSRWSCWGMSKRSKASQFPRTESDGVEPKVGRPAVGRRGSPQAHCLCIFDQSLSDTIHNTKRVSNQTYAHDVRANTLVILCGRRRSGSLRWNSSGTVQSPWLEASAHSELRAQARGALRPRETPSSLPPTVPSR